MRGTNFFIDSLPVKADLARHTKREQMIRQQIFELESLESPTAFSAACLETYRGLLGLLLQSKAEVASKIGRRK